MAAEEPWHGPPVDTAYLARVEPSPNMPFRCTPAELGEGKGGYGVSSTSYLHGLLSLTTNCYARAPKGEWLNWGAVCQHALDGLRASRMPDAVAG